MMCQSHTHAHTRLVVVVPGVRLHGRICVQNCAQNFYMGSLIGLSSRDYGPEALFSQSVNMCTNFVYNFVYKYCRAADPLGGADDGDDCAARKNEKKRTL